MSEDPGQITLFSKPLNNAYIWNTAILPGEYLGELLAALSASQFKLLQSTYCVSDIRLNLTHYLI